MRRVTLVFSCIALLSIALALPARAASVTVGGVAWYAWWMFPFESAFTGSGAKGGSIKFSLKMNDNTIQYGPMLSVRFNEKWSLAGVFIFGVHKGFTASSSYYMLDYNRMSTAVAAIWGGSPIYTGAIRLTCNDIDRYDVDLTVNYSLSSLFKLFFGAKYQGFSYRLKIEASLARTPYYPQKQEFYLHTAGAGAGAGITVPMGKGFFWITNVSGILMAGQTKLEQTNSAAVIKTTTQFGVNANAGVAYSFSRPAITLALGYRIQATWFGDGKFIVNKAMTENIFHGVQFSTTYTF